MCADAVMFVSRYTYESLKANIPQILAESEAPYDPDSGQPYIQMIEYRVRL